MRLGVRSCALGMLFLFMCYMWLACKCGVGFQCTLMSVMYCMCMDLCVRVNGSLKCIRHEAPLYTWCLDDCVHVCEVYSACVLNPKVPLV